MSQVLTFIQRFRFALAQPKTTVHLCALGIIGGVFAASIIILFRLSIDLVQSLIAMATVHYQLPNWVVRVISPLIAVIGILSIALLTGFKHYRLGIPFVIHRIKMHFGAVPFRTSVNQFFGGMFAIASGFVVGREGPSVHLGAASSSFMGQVLKLPYNSIRILSSCGIAAGISASFNTPLAAVIFVMEVVLREYRIHMFVPVMLAAACGTVMTRAVFGTATELHFFNYTHINQWMFVYLVVLGVSLGALAALFNRQLMWIMTLFRPVSMVTRLSIAGVITACAGVIFPDALGANFESISELISHSPEVRFIALILVVKMLLATSAIGLGIPGGIIGPVMVLGMLSGMLLLTPLTNWVETEHYFGTFALLGLAGMLSAVLHAPLAALTAVMELSYSPEIILPAMVVIVPAYVTSTQLFKNRSIFLQQLDYQKLEYAVNPVRESLEKIGVLAAMDSQFKIVENISERALIDYFLEHPKNLVLQKHTFEKTTNIQLVQYNSAASNMNHTIQKLDLQGINSQSTVAGVYDILKRNRSGAIYIFANTPDEIIGIVTWEKVQTYLQQTTLQ